MQEITVELAQNIVMDMKKIINQDINYMNEKGIIVASTDVKRVGSFHGGAKKVSKTNNKLIINYNEEYTGSFKGINLPIYFNHEIVGVLGITGEAKEVEKYGEIIKRMTELIIKDAYFKQLSIKEMDNQRLQIEELLTYEENESNEFLNDIFRQDTNSLKTVVVAKIYHRKSDNGFNKEKIFNLIQNHINGNSRNLMMQEKNKIILILHGVSYKNMNNILQSIANELKDKIGITIKFGIGTQEREIWNIKGAYEKAGFALKICLNNSSKSILFYDEMDIELLLMNISEENLCDFIGRVFKSLNKSEINSIIEIIHLYEIHNGSIKRISEALFIHKNTLQYQLNKILSKTGYDPRIYKDFVVLKMAILAYTM